MSKDDGAHAQLHEILLSHWMIKVDQNFSSNTNAAFLEQCHMNDIVADQIFQDIKRYLNLKSLKKKLKKKKLTIHK